MAWRSSEKDIIRNYPQLAKRMGLIKEEKKPIRIGDYLSRVDRLVLQYYKARNQGKVKITETELFDTLKIFEKQYIEAMTNESR